MMTSSVGNRMEGAVSDFHQVDIDRSARLSPFCSVVGRVSIGEGCSIFAGTHIRGDVASVRVGDRTNIQENCCLHVSSGYPLAIGEDVTVGHGAILHGCTIGDGCLVGMGSIVMDGAVVGENCLIGAGALVTQGKTFPVKSLIIGSPACAVRELSEEEIRTQIMAPSASYRKLADVMLDDGLMEAPSPLTDIWPEH